MLSIVLRCILGIKNPCLGTIRKGKLGQIFGFLVGDGLVGYRDACRAILLWIPTAMLFFQWVVSFNRS